MRVFISIELPEQIRKEISKEFEKLENSGFVAGNFVNKNNIHLTLKFLGNISEEQVEKIKKKLSDISFPKFEVKIGDIGFFPSEQYVRIIWVGLLADELKKLKEIIDKNLLEIGINSDGREFSSHITVARIKKINNKDNFLKKIKELKLKKMSFTVEKVALMKSELTRDGPNYKTLGELNLKE